MALLTKRCHMISIYGNVRRNTIYKELDCSRHFPNVRLSREPRSLGNGGNYTSKHLLAGAVRSWGLPVSTGQSDGAFSPTCIFYRNSSTLVVVNKSERYAKTTAPHYRMLHAPLRPTT